MGAFVGANLSVAVFCAFALLLLTLSHGPAAVSANCAQNLCAHPCSVSNSACQNCHRIDVPAQCGGNGGGYGGGGGKHSTVVIYGNHNAVLTRQRREHDEVMPDAAAGVVVKRGWGVDVKSEIQIEKQKNKPREHDEVMPDAAAVDVVPSLVRAKRGWNVDVKSEIQMEKQKNKAHLEIHGNHNEAMIKQS